MTEFLTAKEACNLASLSLKNNACPTPENLILSASDDKIKTYIASLVSKSCMKGQFYLPLYVYGVKAKQAFMRVVEELNQQQKYSFVIGELPDETMMVTVTWKTVWDENYQPYIKITT